jgi:predicted RNase H-like HicB family nuclease
LSASNGRKKRVAKLRIEIEREDDGCFIAKVPKLPRVMVYGATAEDAIAKAQALALRVIADRIEHGVFNL